jgi:hypothetical protein
MLRELRACNRREQYRGDGTHDLWLSIGGSAGHGGLWSVHVAEGVVDEQFAGRGRDVSVQTPNEARADRIDARDAAKREAARKRMLAEQAAVLDALDAELISQPAATRTRIRERTGYGSAKVGEILAGLVDAGVIEEIEFERKSGNGATRATTGFRRVNG